MCERKTEHNGHHKKGMGHNGSECAMGNPSLDKLGQLGTNHFSEQKKYRKKARGKVLTDAVTRKMLSANIAPKVVANDDGSTHVVSGYTSPNTIAYLRTFACCNYIYQDGQKVTSFYCKNRWCINCNRIRAAILIQGYVPSLGEMEDKQFVTLTIPNVRGKELSLTIEKMYKAFVRVKGQLKKAHQRGQLPKFNGLRKVECTYNEEKNTYHPHFHLIVEGREMANELVSRWLREFPEASSEAQDIRKADDGSAMELFKYFTKLFNDGKFHGKALDTIFVAIRGKRIFQPYGNVRKVSEDIPELISDHITFKGQRVEVWKWMDEVFDWIAPDGETFSDYIPSERIRQVHEDSLKGIPDTTQIGHEKSKPREMAQHHQRTHTRKENPSGEGSTNATRVGNNLKCGKQPPDPT